MDKATRWLGWQRSKGKASLGGGWHPNGVKKIGNVTGVVDLVHAVGMPAASRRELSLWLNLLRIDGRRLCRLTMMEIEWAKGTWRRSRNDSTGHEQNVTILIERNHHPRCIFLHSIRNLTRFNHHRPSLPLILPVLTDFDTWTLTAAPAIHHHAHSSFFPPQITSTTVCILHSFTMNF